MRNRKQKILKPDHQRSVPTLFPVPPFILRQREAEENDWKVPERQNDTRQELPESNFLKMTRNVVQVTASPFADMAFYFFFFSRLAGNNLNPSFTHF